MHGAIPVRSQEREKENVMRVAQIVGGCGLAVALAGCSSSSNSENFGKGTPVNIVGTTFSPNTLTITAGKETQFDIANPGSIEHNFTVEEAKVATDLATGSKNSVKVKIDKPGTYELFCRYHKNGGMIGTITVTKAK